MKTNLYNRMKRYEDVSDYRLCPKVPLIIRVDGRAFHSLPLNKPFDQEFMDTMVLAAEIVARDMMGFRVAYIQSDEASFFLSDYEKHETGCWFDYRLNKLVSMSSSLMTLIFNELKPRHLGKCLFDARVFSVPKEDVVNYFLSRAKDWSRNSLSMYARAFFSHKELLNKNRENIHQMLFNIDRCWVSDLSNQQKNGTFVKLDERNFITCSTVVPHFESISRFVGEI